MAPARRLGAAITIVTVLALVGTTPGAATTDRGPRQPASAPQVVVGKHHELFFGLEFDYYCQLGGSIGRAMGRLSRLARMVERSGRTVMFTVAPNKSMVMPDQLRSADLPHHRCDRRGMAEQRRLLDDYDDDRFVSLRSALASDDRQVYWKTDHHWTSVAGTILAKSLAERLDPALKPHLRYRPSTLTMLGVLNAMLGRWVEETAEAAVPSGRARVQTAPGSTDWQGMPDVVFDHSWVSRPARLTWPGDTLVVGDSFGIHVLENLRPLFRRGRFMWVNHTGVEAVVEAIRDAETVVFEVYQTGAGQSVMALHPFYRAVRKALRKDLR
jgi:hypothetical protein